VKLHGFNNLTKSLCFNMYDVCYAGTLLGRQKYIDYIDSQYNAKRLTSILTDCVDIVGAHVLNVAKQDYEPQGSSVTMLVCEDPLNDKLKSLSETVVAHLDKSHICVHTYPEMHPSNGIATFRADIELSTCGDISPLESLNYLLNKFDADVLNIDYTIRGFVRDEDGTHHFKDHAIDSIKDFIDPSILCNYESLDVNNELNRTYHTKMRHNSKDLDRYVFAGYRNKGSKVIEGYLDEEITSIYNN
jgi:S-adenosylmethionine decarboxylase